MVISQQLRQAFNSRRLCFEGTCEHGEVESPDMLWNNSGATSLKRNVDNKKKQLKKKMLMR